jgi:hypothetical protein
MFVESGPYNWTKLHFAVWKDKMTELKGYVEVGDKPIFKLPNTEIKFDFSQINFSIMRE